MCKKCPAGTDISPGGPISKSVCLKCPRGSFVNEDGTDCLCPAGYYRTIADQPLGYKRIACNPCQARGAYISDDGHTKEACSMCRIPLVANKDHTDCGKPQTRCTTHCQRSKQPQLLNLYFTFLFQPDTSPPTHTVKAACSFEQLRAILDLACCLSGLGAAGESDIFRARGSLSSQQHSSSPNSSSGGSGTTSGRCSSNDNSSSSD